MSPGLGAVLQIRVFIVSSVGCNDDPLDATSVAEMIKITWTFCKAQGSIGAVWRRDRPRLTSDSRSRRRPVKYGGHRIPGGRLVPATPRHRVVELLARRKQARNLLNVCSGRHDLKFRTRDLTLMLQKLATFEWRGDPLALGDFGAIIRASAVTGARSRPPHEVSAAHMVRHLA